MHSQRILILGGSGTIGNALYKALNKYYDTYATYYSNSNLFFEKNTKFYSFNFEKNSIENLVNEVEPDVIISSLRGNFNGLISLHQRLLPLVLKKRIRLFFLSSSNVFDSFYHYPSYELDKTFSESNYGRLKIQIENYIMRYLPEEHYAIIRLPMIFGKGSYQLKIIKEHHQLQVPIEVFPNVIINATSLNRLTQQIHYLINRNKKGIFHLGSNDVIHHNDLIKGICDKLQLKSIRFKQVYSSNTDRYLAVLSKYTPLPEHLQFKIDDVIADCEK